jgi:hypothetical protein
MLSTARRRDCFERRRREWDLLWGHGERCALGCVDDCAGVQCVFVHPDDGLIVERRNAAMEEAVHATGQLRDIEESSISLRACVVLSRYRYSNCRGVFRVRGYERKKENRADG